MINQFRQKQISQNSYYQYIINIINYYFRSNNYFTIFKNVLFIKNSG